jgi:hypothetical protein
MGVQVHFAILHCNETDDATEDECILKFDEIQFWEGPMKGGRDRNTDTFLVFPPGKNEAMVSLTDVDWPTNDHLGSHVIRRDELGQGWHRAYFRNEDADYHLDYEVFNAV